MTYGQIDIVTHGQTELCDIIYLNLWSEQWAVWIKIVTVCFVHAHARDQVSFFGVQRVI